MARSLGFNCRAIGFEGAQVGVGNSSKRCCMVYKLLSTRLYCPERSSWLATANNPPLSLEIARRCVRIRIDSRHDRPWLLDGFKHSPLEDWVGEHRPRLIGALLTIVRAWIAAGKKVERTSFGSFDAWARVLGGILKYAEIPGFLGHLEDLYEAADLEGNEWREFTAAWWDRFGPRYASAAELLGLATEKGLLAAAVGDGGPHSQRTRIGRALAAMRDRQFGTYRICTRRDARTKNQTYGLLDVTSGDTRSRAEVLPLFLGSTEPAVGTVGTVGCTATRENPEHEGSYALESQRTDPPRAPHPPQPTGPDLADFKPEEDSE